MFDRLHFRHIFIIYFTLVCILFVIYHCVFVLFCVLLCSGDFLVKMIQMGLILDASCVELIGAAFNEGMPK